MAIYGCGYEGNESDKQKKKRKAGRGEEDEIEKGAKKEKSKGWKGRDILVVSRQNGAG